MSSLETQQLRRVFSTERVRFDMQLHQTRCKVVAGVIVDIVFVATVALERWLVF